MRASCNQHVNFGLWAILAIKNAYLCVFNCIAAGLLANGGPAGLWRGCGSASGPPLSTATVTTLTAIPPT